MVSAIVEGDGKLLFLISLADWFSAWSETRTGLCLSKQTFQGLIKTLCAQAQLMTELLQKGYLYVIPAKLQTDPLEKRFSQYRQMSGGNFLVSLREVLQSEKTLLCKTLLKEDVTVLEDDCQLTAEQNQFAEIFQMIYDESDFENIELDDDAEEVATVICGCIAKKFLARFKCKACTLFMIGNVTTNQYFHFFPEEI